MMRKQISIALLLGVWSGPMALRAADPAPDAATLPASDAGHDQKLKDIHRLLEASQTTRQAGQMVEQMVQAIRQQHPDVPDNFWAEVQADVHPEAFMEKLVPIYDAHFSADDIREMIKFYESPIGQKLVKEQPSMMRESMKIGQQWGFELGQRIVSRLREKGYLKS